MSARFFHFSSIVVIVASALFLVAGVVDIVFGLGLLGFSIRDLAVVALTLVFALLIRLVGSAFIRIFTER